MEQPNQLFDNRYKLLRTLNTDGATADVWLALDTDTIDTTFTDDGDMTMADDGESGMLVALKIYRPKNALDIEGEQHFREEFKIAYNCRHTNLLQPSSFSVCDGVPYLVIPYCSKGSSEQMIGKPHPVNEIWRFISDVASGLERLHTNQPQIIHQDIKPANILIDDSGSFTITDFGISSKSNGLHDSYYDEERSGTFAYMAPERFGENDTPMPESDIWAFGATLCEILTGKVPFGENGGKSQLEGQPMTSLKGLPTPIRKLIKACLRKEPSKRPTAGELAEAAQVKRFPKNRKKSPFILLSILILALVAGAFYYFFPFSKENKDPIVPEPPQPTITLEEVYEKAKEKMDRDSVSFLESYHVMDSLNKLHYLPAMWEVAHTFGWFNDTISQKRKTWLGIEFDDSNGFPKDSSSIKRARIILEEITESTDTTTLQGRADISLQGRAAYRLAIYNKRNAELREHYLNLANSWATIKNDTALIRNINKTKEKN